MKIQKSIVPTLLACAVATTLVGADKEESTGKDKLAKITCVVSGKAITPDATADYKGGKLYFCCPGCPGAFEKGKEKFAAKANHQLVATKQAKQEKCPFSGGKLNPDTKTKVAGAVVEFCCKNCQGKVAKLDDAKKQIDVVFNDKAFKKAGFKVPKKESVKAAG